MKIVIILAILIVVCAVAASNALHNVRVLFNRPAPVNKYLFTASISVGTDHICTGIIVNNRWILTSAMCIINYCSQLQMFNVSYGSHNRTHVQRTKNTIEKVMIHSDFDKKQLVNNLALVKLSERIKFIPTVVQAAHLSAKDIKGNARAIAIGWEKSDQSVCGFEIWFLFCLCLCACFTIPLFFCRANRIVPKC